VNNPDYINEIFHDIRYVSDRVGTRLPNWRRAVWPKAVVFHLDKMWN